MNKLKMPFIMVVTGPTDSGKTTFVVDLVKNHLLKRVDTVVLFSKNNKKTRDFQFIEDQNNCRYLIVEDEDNFLEETQNVIKRMDQLTDAGCKKHVLMIFDDCATHPVLKPRGIIDRFSIEHRHCNISIIAIGHKFRGAGGIPPTMRLQQRYQVIFKPSSLLELENLIKQAYFREDVEKVKRRLKKLFCQKYNYVVYIPANPYDTQFLVNFEDPLFKDGELEGSMA